MIALIDLSEIKGLILDMDGVLWRDQEPIGDLPAIFKEIQRRNWLVTLATNNATLSADRFLEKLYGFGVFLEKWQIVNSAQVIAQHLGKAHPDGGPVYVIGESGLVTELNAKGFFESEEHPLAVVIGLDRQLTYEKLRIACLLIRSGVPFIGTNPDNTYPTPAGLVPGAGALIACMEAATDRKALTVGKPSPEMYREALLRMSLSPHEALVVGDRLETDIAGAQVLGCRTGLVLSGVTSLESASEWLPQPDIIAQDLQSLIGL